MPPQAKDAVRVAEYLKESVSEALAAFKTGAGPEETQITLAIALKIAWEAIDRAFRQDVAPMAFENVLYVRVAFAQEHVSAFHEAFLQGGLLEPWTERVLTLRAYEAREEGGETVFYVTLGGQYLLRAQQFIEKVKCLHGFVREWTFGCYAGSR